MTFSQNLVRKRSDFTLLSKKIAKHYLPAASLLIQSSQFICFLFIFCNYFNIQGRLQIKQTKNSLTPTPKSGDLIKSDHPFPSIIFRTFRFLFQKQVRFFSKRWSDFSMNFENLSHLLRTVDRFRKTSTRQHCACIVHVYPRSNHEFISKFLQIRS